MLSSKLVQLIEEHWEKLSERTVRRIKDDSQLTHLRQLSEAELRDLGNNILRNLGHWLVASSRQQLAERWERSGRLRQEERIPLHEAVRGLQILKECILEFIRDEASPQTTIDIYAEEEFELQLGRFFDCVVYHMVKGYEQGVSKAAQAAVAR